MPWLYAVLTFVAGVLLRLQFYAGAAATFAAAAAYFIYQVKRDRSIAIWAGAVGLLLGIGLTAIRLPVIAPNYDIPLAGDAVVVGVSRKSIVIATAGQGKIRLLGFKNLALPAKHAKIRYSCKPQPMPDFSFSTFEKLSGVRAWCKVTALEVLQKPNGIIDRLRASTLHYLYDKFDKLGDKSLIAAFLLGNTEALNPQELDAFRNMGLMHLFAVSGLNIALLFGLIYLPFRWAKLPALGSALGYTIASGFLLLLDFPVPLLRAWIFMTLGLGMRVLDRRITAGALLFLTALFVELWFPLSTFTLSFILSFGVTAAIIVLYPHMHFCFAATNRFTNKLAEHLALTLAAGLPAYVLGYLLFGSAQPWSLIYNFLLVPFSGLYLFAALVYLVFEPARYLIAMLDKLYLKFAGWHSNTVMAWFPMREPHSQKLSLLYVVGLIAVLIYLGHRKQLWSLRRHLRYVVALSICILLLPFLLMRYPQHALYAVPNKVWLYADHKIVTAGTSVFANQRDLKPTTCIPIYSRAVAEAEVKTDRIRVHSDCFIFAGRMRPETWSPTELSRCNNVQLFVAKNAKTSETEWSNLFSLFGFHGTLAIRHYFTWYADQPLGCGKSERL